MQNLITRKNVMDCNALYNGIWLAKDPTNGPGEGWWMIVSCGDATTRKQLAYGLTDQSNPQTRNYSAGVASAWKDL